MLFLLGVPAKNSKRTSPRYKPKTLALSHCVRSEKGMWRRWRWFVTSCY